MNIIQLFQSFQTNEQAIQYLEKVRWKGNPVCPYCGGTKIKGQRWQCQYCHSAFAVTVGTIFHGTHIPLQKWYIMLALMLNAKKSASACQIARDLGIRRATVWSMMHRARDKYAPLYISEASYKYNTRSWDDSFEHMLGLMVAA